MQHSTPFCAFFRLGILVLFLTLLTGCGKSARNKIEEARVLSILVNCRAFATDHEGNYPKVLADLHPKYVDLVDVFYSPPYSVAEDKPQAYYYRTGLKVGALVDEPLVVSPHVIKGKVNVGYLGGFIRTLDKEEAERILKQPDWTQQAPPPAK
jgi:hypothetical protein